MITECSFVQLNTSIKYINSNLYLILHTKIIFSGIKVLNIFFIAGKNLEGSGIVYLCQFWMEDPGIIFWRVVPV